jgi:hypothetical protein
MKHDIAREAQRQQVLLRVLWREMPADALMGWMRTPARIDAGLAPYRANAGAHAERALAAAFPTLQQLLGEESFAALARAHWHADPPLRGDLALWGAGLAAFIADDAQLADEPYLADMARLDWAVHQAEQAADAAAASSLALPARVDPQQLRLHLQPGTALLASAWPVVTIWQAHRDHAADAFAPARAALAARQAETALVQRQGWRATVRALPAAEARFIAALWHREPLAAALQAAGDDFDFESWLIAALQGGAIAAVEELS